MCTGEARCLSQGTGSAGWDCCALLKEQDASGAFGIKM